MKERLINVVKWFFIVLGVLFLIQLLLVIGAIAGVSNFARANTNITYNTSNKLKEIQPIINYAEEYQQNNGKYPEKIENIKIKPSLYYTYEPSKDFNCYTITTKSEKDNLTKQYQHCSIKSQNSSSTSESYVEYTSK